MKEQITLEYPISCTVASLYGCLSTELGISGWFSDSVCIKDNTYTFSWRKVNELAKLISNKENSFIRFQWEDDFGSNYYFQFLINAHELTGDISLLVTDFGSESELGDLTNFWDSKVSKLRRLLGDNS